MPPANTDEVTECLQDGRPSNLHQRLSRHTAAQRLAWSNGHKLEALASSVVLDLKRAQQASRREGARDS